MRLARKTGLVTLRMPEVEEIARAIWQRQHDALDAEAVSSSIKWRDQSVPNRFWDEFLLDAQVVLEILFTKQGEYQTEQERGRQQKF